MTACPPGQTILLCVDVETVPDVSLLPADWPCDRFPPPAWHKIVAISVVEALVSRTPDGERYEFVSCRSGGEADWPERRLIAAFWRKLGTRPTRLVTWNGRAFDLPVLCARSMVHGIAAVPFFATGDRWCSYRTRYRPDWHCDLMDQISEHGAATRMRLDDLARALGLPGKIGGHGSEVAEMLQAGRMDDIRAYCEADVLNTAGIYLRWALLTGVTDRLGHDAAAESLGELLRRERGARPHFGAFLDRWAGWERIACQEKDLCR